MAHDADRIWDDFVDLARLTEEYKRQLRNKEISEAVFIMRMAKLGYRALEIEDEMVDALRNR